LRIYRRINSLISMAYTRIPYESDQRIGDSYQRTGRAEQRLDQASQIVCASKSSSSTVIALAIGSRSWVGELSGRDRAPGAPNLLNYSVQFSFKAGTPRGGLAAEPIRYGFHLKS
jgi:hypothetical protein